MQINIGYTGLHGKGEQTVCLSGVIILESR